MPVRRNASDVTASSAKKRIWFFNHYATEMFFDEAGRHYWFSKELFRRGYEPTVFTASTFLRNSDVVNTGKSTFLVEEGECVPFVFVKTPVYNDNGIQRIANISAFFRRLPSVARSYAASHGTPDVIIASSPHPLTLAAGIRVAKQFGVPCIGEIRDLWPETLFAHGVASEKSAMGRILNAGEHWLYRHADALIFTKEGDVDHLKEQGWDRQSGGDIDLEHCHYINNGVDITEFDERSCTEQLKDEDLSSGLFNVVYTGAIRPTNDVSRLVDVAEILRDNRDVRILVYGDGSEREALASRAQNEGFDNIIFKGAVARKQVPYILKNASANLLNYSQSKYNWKRGNSSNKLFEYFASGKPVISSVQMGYCPLAKYDCGFVAHGDSAEALAKEILRVKDMPADDYKRMCYRAREAAYDFDVPTLTAKLIEVIESV